MKKILLSSVALLGLSTVVMAADLPRRQAAPVFTPVVPVFTWTGFYIGANAGYGFSDTDSNDTVFFDGNIVNSTGTRGRLDFLNGDDGDDGGFVGGGQIGYNYQVGAFVLGVEADFQYADIGGREGGRHGIGSGYRFEGTPGVAFAPPSAFVARNGVSSLETFGTVRGRLGFAFDRTLIYATGGFAYGFSDGGDEFTSLVGGRRGDDTRYGYTVGGGLEYAFTNNVTAKIEGLYVNLDENERRFNPVYVRENNTVVLPSGNNGGGSDFFVVRAGLNFKFGGLGY